MVGRAPAGEIGTNEARGTCVAVRQRGARDAGRRGGCRARTLPGNSSGNGDRASHTPDVQWALPEPRHARTLKAIVSVAQRPRPARQVHVNGSYWKGRQRLPPIPSHRGQKARRRESTGSRNAPSRSGIGPRGGHPALPRPAPRPRGEGEVARLGAGRLCWGSPRVGRRKRGPSCAPSPLPPPTARGTGKPALRALTPCPPRARTPVCPRLRAAARTSACGFVSSPLPDQRVGLPRAGTMPMPPASPGPAAVACRQRKPRRCLLARVNQRTRGTRRATGGRGGAESEPVRGCLPRAHGPGASLPPARTTPGTEGAANGF